MLNFIKPKMTTTEIVDIIQNRIYTEVLKPIGFRKYGRTFNRKVDTDIVQVIHLQNGCPSKDVTGVMWVNLGIYVPERAQRVFTPDVTSKKHIKEYECDIRMTLGELTKSKYEYSLKLKPDKIADDIIKKLKKYALPMFDELDNRDKIIANEQKFDYCNMNSHLKLLHNAMIYGRRGDLAVSTELFNDYYRCQVVDFLEDKEIDGKISNGCLTCYKPNTGHIEYLENLADSLGITIYNKFEHKKES